MKKIYTLLSSLFLFGIVATQAQNVLVKQEFEFYANGYHITIDSVGIGLLPGTTMDTLWYTADGDLIPDGSGGTTSRPDAWFALYPFATVDQVPTGYTNTTTGNPDTNTVFGANSWNNNGETAAGLEDNWLISPNFQLGTHDTLFWKSAPRQTPRYCDGYEVLLSTTNNDPAAFTHVLFTAAENTALGTDSTFATYSFAPAGAFVHGLDGTYTEYAHDSIRLIGELRPFSVPLDVYGNMNIFVAFHHNSHDDNLISIDDVMIRGDASNPHAGIAENNLNTIFNIFPNPAQDNAQMSFAITSETSVAMNVYDIAGNLVYSENKGTMDKGQHFATINTSQLAKGFYTVSLTTNIGRTTTKLVVQ